MKFSLCILCFFICSQLTGQTNHRVNYEKELASLIEQLNEQTDANFEMGPMFYFKKPFIAVIEKQKSYSIVNDNLFDTRQFEEGDSILVTGARPVGKLKEFTLLNSDTIFRTPVMGRSNFQIIKNDEFKSQLSKIKSSSWKRAELLSQMLSCGTLESQGKRNFEKHHITFGETPVFFQVRQENERILLYFSIRVYGKTDLDGVGTTVGGTSNIEISFDDGTEKSFICQGEGEDDRFAIIDVTDHKEPFLNGVDSITFKLSGKTISKKLVEESKYAIGFKIECMNP